MSLSLMLRLESTVPLMHSHARTWLHALACWQKCYTAEVQSHLQGRAHCGNYTRGCDILGRQ